MFSRINAFELSQILFEDGADADWRFFIRMEWDDHGKDATVVRGIR